ncbi:hypothetical protein [Clostridium botulinum]|uniref:hypothetical protein n=1 Tax=Clostridium botulinum TaxID=1491 RepID=UPI0007738D26|nr:hypothetical protein [Clostridium botulinum]QDY26977.1 hypothetical protein CGQ40_19935 [Clostridium botulinum]QDY27226.1 hypothetical protein CGQ40_21210 [Clostridium botulinum]
MLLSLNSHEQRNANGKKILDFINKTFNADLDSSNGLVGEKIDKYIEEKVEVFAISFFSKLITLCELGVIGYSMCQSIKIMFLGNKSSKGAKPMDKMLLGYFIFFTLRIFNTVLKIKGNIYGK